MTKERVGGWQQLDQQVVYENPWIKVTHENVVRPNKTKGIYGVVHFKSCAVGIIPLDEDGYTWLVRQSRYTLNAFTWEIPEGGAPEGEEPIECAKRELEEEAGLIADEWYELMTVHTTNSVSDEVGKIFVAKGLLVTEQNLDDSEDIEVAKVHFSEAVNRVLNGEITDALSVCGLLKLAMQEPQLMIKKI